MNNLSEAQYGALVAKVREDIRCHRENGIDLNPFSTAGMRGAWQRGFDGEPKLPQDVTLVRERGILAAQMVKLETP